MTKSNCPINQVLTPDKKKCKELKLNDSGTYGCIITPPIIEDRYIIKNDIKYTQSNNNDIAKIYKTGSKEYKKELKILKKIQKIDPNNIFTIKLKGAQTISSNVLNNNNEITSCLNNNNVKYYYQIILENGGQNLKFDLNIKYKKFIKLFKKFIKGLVILQKHNLVHRDIKPANVLIKEDKISLIDFGLCCKTDDVYKSTSRYVLSYHYPYYPPEFYIASLCVYEGEKGLDISKIIERSYETMIKDRYFDHSYMTPELKKTYENGIKDFINDIKLKKLTKYNDIFTKKIALKADVFPLSQLLATIYNKIKYNNINEKAFIYNIYTKCIECNPYKRISMQELYDILDKTNVP